MRKTLNTRMNRRIGMSVLGLAAAAAIAVPAVASATSNNGPVQIETGQVGTSAGQPGQEAAGAGTPATLTVPAMECADDTCE